MASIDVLLNRSVGTIDRRIFFGVIEHLGRCVRRIYGVTRRCPTSAGSK
jgi:hypothetical protein